MTVGSALTGHPSEFDAPATTTWIRCSLPIILHPLYLCLQFVITRCSNPPDQSDENQPVGFVAPPVVRLSVLAMVKLSLLQGISEYSMCQSVRHVNSTAVIIVLSTLPAFRYLLYWTLLEAKAEAWKIVSALMAIIGIVMLSHSAHSYVDPLFMGVILAAFSSAVSALQHTYMVYVHPSANMAQSSYMYFCMAVINCISGIIVFAFIISFNLETIEFTTAPWDLLFISAAFNNVCLFVYNIAESVIPANMLLVKYAISPLLNIAWDETQKTENRLEMNTFQILSVCAIITSQICWIVPRLCLIRKRRLKKKSQSPKDSILTTVTIANKPKPVRFV